MIYHTATDEELETEATLIAENLAAVHPHSDYARRNRPRLALIRAEQERRSTT